MLPFDNLSEVCRLVKHSRLVICIHDMTKEPKTKPKQASTREGTYQEIVKSLRTNPAYLLLFAIGLLGGAMGVGIAAVGSYRGNTVHLVLGFSTWVLLLIAALLVIRIVERRREPTKGADVFDHAAREAFLSGPAADRLSGRWHVEWFIGEGAERKPYEPDPKEEVTITTHRSRIACSSYDPSLKRTYWLDGRLSKEGIVTLLYWSAPDQGFAAGVVFLLVDHRFEARGGHLSGWWRGFTRSGQVTTGCVEWTRLG
jgi:hypothetical protein